MAGPLAPSGPGLSRRSGRGHEGKGKLFPRGTTDFRLRRVGGTGAQNALLFAMLSERPGASRLIGDLWQLMAAYDGFWLLILTRVLR